MEKIELNKNSENGGMMILIYEDSNMVRIRSSEGIDYNVSKHDGNTIKELEVLELGM